MRNSLFFAALPLALLFSPCAFSQTASSIDAPSISWDVARQDRRITALAQDNRGRIFAASEESGVWMCGTSRHSDKLWRHFTSQNCSIADDNIYALTVDHQNRVWAGTAGHGVSVYNGLGWRNYGVLKAPIGERIFDIVVCPKDGDVWIASNIGLTRYSVAKNTWTTLYPTATLPFNHLQALAFSATGTLFAGTQTDGLLIARPVKTIGSQTTNGQIEYSKWRRVVSSAVVTDTVTGTGLPSNQINDVLVARDKTVYMATSSGLAWSRDGGATWNYKRGSDWVEKARQRFFPAPINSWPNNDGALSEDYVSCLAQDAAGMLWVGHWRRGYEVLDSQAQKVVLDGSNSDKTNDANSRGDGAYVKCILPLPNQAPLIGRYGFGLTVAPKSFDVSTTTKPTTKSSAAPVTQPAFEVAVYPSFQAAPNLKELNALLKQLSLVPIQADLYSPPVVSLDDDWTTHGDWLGRYGRYWANLCAIISPSDYLWGAGQENIRYHSRIGPNADKGDSVRYWVQWLYNDNPNTLELPPIYLDAHLRYKLTTLNSNRRQAEIDDHGEQYPYQKDGPHLFVSLRVPKGQFMLSLYDWNKDGDGGDNRFRDYRVSIRGHNPLKQMNDISDFWTQPELANARIRDFRRGVWKRFVVRGPQELTIQVDKNYGFNTILAGIMLDEMKEQPAPYFRTVREDRVLDAKNDRSIALRLKEPPEIHAKRFAPATTESAAASRLVSELEALRVSNPLWHAQSSRKFYQPLTLWFEKMQQNARDNGADTKVFNAPLGYCYYQMRFFDQWEKCQRKLGLMPARDIEKSLEWDGLDPTSDRQGIAQGFKSVAAFVEQLKVKEESKAKGRSVQSSKN